MGRNAIPFQMHILRGNPNRLTKKQLDEREKHQQIKIGDTELKCPPWVKNDREALEKWKECIEFYKDVSFVSSADSGHLARYCKTFAEYQDLIAHRRRINKIDSLSLDESVTVLQEFKSHFGKREANLLFKKIEYIISVEGILQIDTAINKKMEQLIKMEDRLFLNPLAKIKNIPKSAKPKEEEEEPLSKAGFGNI